MSSLQDIWQSAQVFFWLMILLSVVTESLKAKCVVTGLLKLQVEQRRMDLPLPLKTVMGATAWQQWQQEIAVKMVSKSTFHLSTNDSSVMATSYVCWTSTMTVRGHRDFIEALTVGVSWRIGCNRNGSNLTVYSYTPVYSRHYIWECLSCIYVYI